METATDQPQMELSYDGDKDIGLRNAARAGNLDVVKYLAGECKADANARDQVKQHTKSISQISRWLSCDALQYGNIALLCASCEGHLDVVKYLVEECNADVSARNKVKQHTESIRLLVWFGG